MRLIKAAIDRQRGFTLIELMVVVSIIGVLSILGVPHFRAYLLDTRLNDAVPYLTDIAARNRMHFLETGTYCCGGAGNAEETIANELRAPIDEVGDFCFMVVCRDQALCGTASATDFIAADEAEDAGAEFEVWAILRATTNGAVATQNGPSCSPHPNKRPPTGLAQPANSGKAGRHGQAVVLRYPAPVNGIDTITGVDSHRYDWNAGISKTNALHP